MLQKHRMLAVVSVWGESGMWAQGEAYAVRLIPSCSYTDHCDDGGR